MKKLLFILLFSLSQLSFSSMGEAQQEPSKPKFVIFLLHGFLGSEETFCDLQNILKQEYGNDVAVENLSFPTWGEKGVAKDSDLSFDNVNTSIFSQFVFKGIFDTFDKYQIAADTPYAVVAHSLGGMITLRLALECFNQPTASYCQNSNKKSKVASLPTHLTHLITFMTPFWGSTSANRIIRSPLYTTFFPDQQTRDLAVGSDWIDQTRKEIIQRQVLNEPVFAANTQIINISASLDDGFYSWVLRQTADLPPNAILETDPAVPAPSSRIDFLYKIYDKSGKVTEGNTNIAQTFYPMHGIHGKIPGSDFGLACVNSKTINLDSYLILKNAFNPILKANSQDLIPVALHNDAFIPSLNTYRVEVRMNLPDDPFLLGAFLPENIHITTMRDATDIASLQRKNDFTNDYTSFNIDSRTKKNYVTFFRTGYFSQASGFSAAQNFATHNNSIVKEEVNIDVHLPWYQNKHLTAQVSPSYSTYVEFDLENKAEKLINQMNLGEDKTPAVLSAFYYSERTGLFGGSKGPKDQVRALIYDPNTDQLKLEQALPDFNWQATLAKNYKVDSQILSNSCYIADVDAFHKNQFLYYKNFRDEKPDFRIPLEREFQVFARVTDGEKQADGYFERDRVLVNDYKVAAFYGAMWPRPSAKFVGVVWMNTRDVRLLRPCGSQP